MESKPPIYGHKRWQKDRQIKGRSKLMARTTLINRGASRADIKDAVPVKKRVVSPRAVFLGNGRNLSRKDAPKGEVSSLLVQPPSFCQNQCIPKCDH